MAGTEIRSQAAQKRDGPGVSGEAEFRSHSPCLAPQRVTTAGDFAAWSVKRTKMRETAPGFMQPR
jgi:hypothetical protein